MGQQEEAIDAMKKVIGIKEDFIDAYNNLGIMHSTMGKHREALNIYMLASDSELFFNIATVYSLLRKHDIALDNLRKAIELNGELKEEARYNGAFSALRGKTEFRELVS